MDFFGYITQERMCHSFLLRNYEFFLLYYLLLILWQSKTNELNIRFKVWFRARQEKWVEIYFSK